MVTGRFQINTPFVASQVIDGEVILINFDSGAYYSACRSGARVLALIEAGQSVEQIVEWLARSHGAARETVEREIGEFIAELEGEALIVAAENVAGAELPPTATATTPFEAPRLEKFDDLKDILLLDPIHDGGQPAWPGRKGGDPGGSQGRGD